MSGGRAGGPCSEGPCLGAELGWRGGFLYSEIPYPGGKGPGPGLVWGVLVW